MPELEETAGKELEACGCATETAASAQACPGPPDTPGPEDLTEVGQAPGEVTPPATGWSTCWRGWGSGGTAGA